jgi:regulator-associated protein of mTOR
VLFHYNGHGVPRPTANGEVWVFNKSYTQYIPLSIYDLQVHWRYSTAWVVVVQQGVIPADE